MLGMVIWPGQDRHLGRFAEKVHTPPTQRQPDTGGAKGVIHSLQVTIKTNLLAELKHQAPNYQRSTNFVMVSEFMKDAQVIFSSQVARPENRNSIIKNSRGLHYE